MPTSLRTLLLALLLLATLLGEPAATHADDCPADDHCLLPLTLVYLPIVAGVAASSEASPMATATPVVRPPVNRN